MTAAIWSAALLAGGSAVALVRALGVGHRRVLRAGGTRALRARSVGRASGPHETGPHETRPHRNARSKSRPAGHGGDAGVASGGAGPMVAGTTVTRTVVVVVLVLALVVLGPIGAGGACIVAVLTRADVLRRRRRRRDRAVDQAMPELIGLFVIAAAAGHPVAACVEAVAVRAPPAVREPLAEVIRRVGRGAPLTESLERLGPVLGPLGPNLVDALVGAQRTGAPLAPVLGRLAVTARDRRIRSAEEAARRLPVTLLFPLVCCVLPAFALLAVVPLLAASLDALRL